MINSELRHYAVKNQQDWDSYVTLLTYSFNFHVYSATKLAPFVLFLSRHPPDPANPTTMKMEPDVENGDFLLVIWLPRQPAALPRQVADKNLNVAQKYYKADQNSNVCFEPIYAPRDYIFWNRPPLTNYAFERLTAEGYTTLMRNRYGPHRVLSVRPEYLKSLQKNTKTQSVITMLHL